MTDATFLWALLGAFSLICGAGLAIVKIDRDVLQDKVHTNPMLALYRFPAFRWGIALFSTVTGVALLAAGFGFWVV